MFVVLRQRNFALLWAADVISSMGNWMLLVGLPVYTYTLTHSIAATSGTFLADQIPQILLGSVAGVFVDRWDHKWVIVITDLLLACGLLPLLFFHSASQLWIVYVVAVIESIISQFLTAESALLPHLVSEEQLVSANALGAFSSSATRLIGPTVGGLVAALLGLSGIAVLDALTFLLASLLTACIAVDRTLQHSLVPTDIRRSPWWGAWREWLEGLQVIRRERIITGFFMVMSIAAFADGLFIVLFAPFVKTILHGGAAEIGYLTSTQAAGGLIGGVLVPRLSKWLSPSRLIALSGLILGVAGLLLFNYSAVVPGLVPAFICFTLIGIATAGFFIQLTTLLQKNAPDSYRGRLFGAYSMTWALFLLLGTILTGIVGDQASIIPLLNLEAILFFPAALVALVLLRSHAAVPSHTGQTDQQDDQVTASL